MNTKTRWAGTAVLAAAVAALVSCSGSDEMTAAPRASSLVVSAAVPADGNVTLTHPASFDPDFAPGIERALLIQGSGGCEHQVDVQWDTATHAVLYAGYTWGPPGAPPTGRTSCVTGTLTDCDPSTIVVDPDTKSVTFAGATIDGHATAWCTSTLDGTLVW